MQESNLLPAKAVRAIFGVSASITLTRWVERGLLPEPQRINGRKYWPVDAVEKLKAGAAKAGAE